MTDATNDPHAPLDVLRARRVELVDDLGEARIVLGNLALDVDDDYWPGVAIRSPEGRDRAWLMLHADGVQLEFDMGGNVVAGLGVLDPGGESFDPGARLVLCDADGAVVVGWHISIDGTWERLSSRT